MKNIVTHNYAPLRSTFVRCCISEVVGVDVKQRAPQQNPKIQYDTRYGILRHYTATFTFRRQKYKHTTTNKYEVLQLRHVVQSKHLWCMFPPCAYRSRFLYSALLRDRDPPKRSLARVSFACPLPLRGTLKSGQVPRSQQENMPI